MSDSPSNSPRPVSLFVIFFVMILSAAFLAAVWRFYRPVTVAPQNGIAENFPLEVIDPKTQAKTPAELAWKATPASRKKALADLREKQAAQAKAYAWIDQKAGVVQLPLDRAMELTAQKYGAKK